MRWSLVIALVGCSGGCSGGQKSADLKPGVGLPARADGIEISEAESAADMTVVLRSYDAETAEQANEGIQLDKEQIRRVVRKHAGQIRSCGQSKPGVVRVSFTIGPEGNVTEATARGIDRKVEDCLETMFRQFLFPAPPSNVQVTYPFAFDAG